MHRRIRYLLYLLVVLLVAANAFSDIFSFYDSYYSDGTWTTQVGEHDKECDGSVSTNWGTTSNFRLRFSTRCSNGNTSLLCQELVDGAWVPATCP
jgi:hypothetical protein